MLALLFPDVASLPINTSCRIHYFSVWSRRYSYLDDSGLCLSSFRTDVFASVDQVCQTVSSSYFFLLRFSVATNPRPGITLVNNLEAGF